MKILILTNWSANIAELNALTAPNKETYCKLHGYDFENVEHPYEKHVEWLKIIQDRVKSYDVVMTMGCDTIFTNTSVRIEDRISAFYGDYRVSMAREHISWWPVNNDVMLWPVGTHSFHVLEELIKSAQIWMSYPWLWQNHLWNLIQAEERTKRAIRIVEAREMSSTFQPFIIDAQNNAVRLPGSSSWQLGDWILHAVDMPPDQRVQVIKWGLQYVGDGTYIPKSN